MVEVNSDYWNCLYDGKFRDEFCHSMISICTDIVVRVAIGYVRFWICIENSCEAVSLNNLETKLEKT